jgi:ubiquinone/menaquinone biosynthesis C-methylase UbiE
MSDLERTFIPAAGRDWLLPFYDPFQWLLGGDAARRELVAQAALQPGHRVLDIGCGTGSLVVLVKRLHPEAEAVGLDPDPKALARARRKAERAGIAARFDQGFSDALPYPDASLDRVFSSFMLHHLDAGVKRKTLAETRRVLRPGGSLHLLDFGGSQARPDGLLARLLHAADDLRDNFEGRIPALMGEAGFGEAAEAWHRTTLLGRITSYRAV